MNFYLHGMKSLKFLLVGWVDLSLTHVSAGLLFSVLGGLRLRANVSKTQSAIELHIGRVQLFIFPQASVMVVQALCYEETIIVVPFLYTFLVVQML